jgi:hypothetical protein
VTVFVVVAVVVLSVFFVVNTHFSVKINIFMTLVALVTSALSACPAVIRTNSVHEETFT